jgi:hypothetical protein
MEITWDDAVVNVYVNGSIQRSMAFPVSVNTPNNFFLGQRSNNSEFFNGQLTAVTAFDRVLSDSERTTIGKAFARELGVTYG